MKIHLLLAALLLGGAARIMSIGSSSLEQEFNEQQAQAPFNACKEKKAGDACQYGEQSCLFCESVRDVQGTCEMVFPAVGASVDTKPIGFQCVEKPVAQS